MVSFLSSSKAFSVSLLAGSLLVATAQPPVDYSYPFPDPADLMDYSSFLGNVVDPDVCRLENDACWLVLDSEPSNQFSDCCQDVTNGAGEVLACVGNPFSATCTFVAPDPSQFDPKGINGVDWNVFDIPTSGGTIFDACPAVANLGPLFSASTGFTDEPFPLLGQQSFLDFPYGREPEIGFFVGGNYFAPLAAEIEGNILVLGNFEIGTSGTSTIGWAGVGSGIFPEPGVFMRVGGDLTGGKQDGTTQAITDGSIEYGGECLSVPQVTRLDYPPELQCGTIFVQQGGASLTQTPLDAAPFNALLDDLKVRSEYWYKLKPNGKYVTRAGGPDQNTLVLYAGDDECLQVFTLDRFALTEAFNIALDQSLVGKTLLINVSPFDENGEISTSEIKSTGQFFDPWGGNDRTFSSETKQSMLWNFYKATKVTLGGPVEGGGTEGGIQFPGSLLIPYGDLDMLWPGQDGRTIVGGNVFHNDTGSEFHNYEFDPPCPLPLPPCFPKPAACEADFPGPPPPICSSSPPTSSPTEAGCPATPPGPTPGSEYCPEALGVQVLSVLGTDISPNPDILFDLTPYPADNSIKFRVDNPFDKNLKVFVKYNEPSATAGYGWDYACNEEEVGPCGEVSELFEADCLHADGNPYTLLQLYFVDDSPPSIFGADLVDHIPECCHAGDVPADAVAQFSILVRCDCPGSSSGRRQLRSGSSSIEDILKVFEEASAL